MGNRKTPVIGRRYYYNCNSFTRIFVLLDETMDGIPIPPFLEKWKDVFYNKRNLQQTIDRLSRYGFIRIEGNKLYYTPSGSEKRKEILEHISNNLDIVKDMGIDTEWIKQ